MQQRTGTRRAWSRFGLLLAAGLCAGTCLGQESAPAPVSPSLEVRFLANAGFLIRADGAGVIVDAFLAKPYTVYGALPDDVLSELVAGGAPFHDLRLALVTHAHEDHIQADMARLFLLRRPGVDLVAPPQGVDSLRRADGTLPPHVTAMWPDSGRVGTFDTGVVHVECLRLPHGSERHATVQNLAYVIDIGGRRVVHVGDAAMQPEAYAPYADNLRDLDVALVPYWFFEDEAGRRTLATYLRARHVIAMHLPVREAASISARLQESDPDVLVFSEPLQFQRY